MGLIVLGVLSGLAVGAVGLFILFSIASVVMDWLVKHDDRWWSFPLYMSLAVVILAPFADYEPRGSGLGRNLGRRGAMSLLTCICCGKQLGNIMEGHPSGAWQANDGLVFFTYGHYGSTYFDPMDMELDVDAARSNLQIVVCDPCVEAAENKGIVLRRAHSPRGER